MGRTQALKAFNAVQTGDASKPRIFCAHDQYPKKPARIIGRAEVWDSSRLRVFGLKAAIAPCSQRNPEGRASREFGRQLIVVSAIAALLAGFWALINRPVTTLNWPENTSGFS
jgi:hypothetical protein